ncbi:hypothetical protein [Oceanobacter sp. 3_MG-2023]|uniref:hypothetical protein n=1 Tax=Oceanobacter sp. 3_MG-2023 TaxID=3062622 RepID=UPI002732FA38|nr:hypothetical protein [Oceanobacter sp. 3_MG-2023]MDP2507139.1 hypothetical protein [Oceanobacter sp. 3_MG-2023]
MKIAGKWLPQEAHDLRWYGCLVTARRYERFPRLVADGVSGLGWTDYWRQGLGEECVAWLQSSCHAIAGRCKPLIVEVYSGGLSWGVAAGVVI